MKFKAAVANGTPNEIISVLGSEGYATDLLKRVVEGYLGARDVLSRPSEYYLQHPDITVGVADNHGVEVRLTGATRSGRTPTALRNALAELEHITLCHIRDCRKNVDDNDRVTVQVFCVLMLDAEIHIGNGAYSSIVETEPKKILV